MLIYEMTFGYPRFYADNPFSVYQKILQSKIDSGTPQMSVR